MGDRTASDAGRTRVDEILSRVAAESFRRAAHIYFSDSKRHPDEPAASQRTT